MWEVGEGEAFSWDDREISSFDVHCLVNRISHSRLSSLLLTIIGV